MARFERVPDRGKRIEVLRHWLDLGDELRARAHGFIHGFLFTVAIDERAALLDAVANGVDDGQRVRLFTAAPFTQQTWRLLDGYPPEIRDAYWREVVPHWFPRHSEAEIREMIDRLLAAQRPRAAFTAVHIDWPRVDASRLKRLLTGVATVKQRSAGNLPVAWLGHFRGFEVAAGSRRRHRGRHGADGVPLHRRPWNAPNTEFQISNDRSRSRP